MSTKIEQRLRAVFRHGAILLDDLAPDHDPLNAPLTLGRVGPDSRRCRRLPVAGSVTGRAATSARFMAPALGAGAVVVIVLSIAVVSARGNGGTGSARPPSASGMTQQAGQAYPGAPASTAGSPSAPNVDSTTHPSLMPGATQQVGSTYTYRWFIHCGLQFAEFGGQSWRVADSAPAFPGFETRPGGGGSSNGYLEGTVTLLDRNTLRFEAGPGQIAGRYIVTFHPYRATSTGQGVCA